LRKQASVLGEFGALSRLVEGHIWENDRSWSDNRHADEKQLTDDFVAYLEQLRLQNALGLSGAIYIQTYDVERGQRFDDLRPARGEDAHRALRLSRPEDSFTAKGYNPHPNQLVSGPNVALHDNQTAERLDGS
jgi:hypothetical protein